MKPMSSQQAKEFLSFLTTQEEVKIEAFVSTPSGSSYKDEMRAEAETYGLLARDFAEYLNPPISNSSKIIAGLTAEQVTEFVYYLNDKIRTFESSQAEIRQKRQAALAGVNDMEYSRIKSIYKEMESLVGRQRQAFETARETFMQILG